MSRAMKMIAATAAGMFVIGAVAAALLLVSNTPKMYYASPHAHQPRVHVASVIGDLKPKMYYAAKILRGEGWTARTG